MHRSGIWLLFALGMTQAVHADNVSIAGGAATVTSNPESSYWFTLGVNKTGTSSQLAGWQLLCQIIPTAGAEGTVYFGGVAKPTDYVFGDSSPDIIPPEQSVATILGPVLGFADNAVEGPIGQEPASNRIEFI